MKRWTEGALLLTGVLLLGAAGWKALKYEAFQNHPSWFVGTSRQTSLLLPEGFPNTHVLGPVHVLGRLEVPRLRLSVLIVDGDDDANLDLGAGHVPGTAPIGATGNSVIAGHRDTTFRALRKIRRGDQIRIESDRVYVYSVETIEIVNPDDIRALNATTSPTLTLVTCYPFRFIGDAPRRYVVQARRLPT